MKAHLSNSIAIIGGGPGGLFMYKRLVENFMPGIEIHIYEKNNDLGYGMPYGHDGAEDEHITNVSGNEIPELVTTVSEWIKTVPKDTLDKYNIDPEKFNEYKVLPRLLFGQYLNAQFKMLLKKGKDLNINTTVHYNTKVTDIIDQPGKDEVIIVTDNGRTSYNSVVICSGHIWPKGKEGEVTGWFDSPYPPQKIAMRANHPIAIRGASLTAIDAIRTLARHNGRFEKDDKGILHFYVNEDSPDFKIAIHTRNGLLPAVRFHLEDSHLGKDTVLSDEQVKANREENDGFLSLDYVFEQNFKSYIRKNDPEYYNTIASLNMEAFVDQVMSEREEQDPFDLLKKEYVEARESIKRHESVYWKEMLAVLSFAMNYPAKYFSAEDRLRLQKTLMPLISVVIAFVPQSSAEALMALHNAGRLSMVTVSDDSEVIPHNDGGAVYKYADEQGSKHEDHYPLFIDSIGQKHLSYKDIPFRSLIDNHTASHAALRFRDASVGRKLLDKGDETVIKGPDDEYYLIVPGIAINDHFQLLDKFNALNDRIYVMAVPLIAGYNPDYSGLDFSEAASAAIIEAMTGDKLAKAS